MKKLILITILFVFLLTGFASAQDTAPDPLYQDLINELTSIMKGQDNGKLTVEEDYSVMITWLTGQPASVNIGYALQDVDGNGVQELLVGENWGNSEQGTVLYDMYTIRDGKILLQRRADNGKWGLVGGLLELDETYEQAALREIREETGLAVRLTAFLGIFPKGED